MHSNDAVTKTHNPMTARGESNRSLPGFLPYNAKSFESISLRFRSLFLFNLSSLGRTLSHCGVLPSFENIGLSFHLSRIRWELRTMVCISKNVRFSNEILLFQSFTLFLIEFKQTRLLFLIYLNTSTLL